MTSTNQEDAPGSHLEQFIHSIFCRRPSCTFDLCPKPFCLKPGPFRRTAWPGGSSWARTESCLPEVFTKFIKTILPIALLVTVTLGREHELAQLCKSMLLLYQEACLDVFRQTRTAQGIPAEHRFRGHLVHILPARTAGAHETP